MVQSSSWAANRFAASQEIPSISRNPKVHYRTHKRPPPVSILDQPNPVHIPTSHLLEFLPNIIHPSTPRSPQWIKLWMNVQNQQRTRMCLSVNDTAPPPSKIFSPLFILQFYVLLWYTCVLHYARNLDYEVRTRRIYNFYHRLIPYYQFKPRF